MQNVILKSVQFTNVGEVDKGGLLSSNSNYLRWFHYKLLLLTTYHGRVFLAHDVEHPFQKLQTAKRYKSVNLVGIIWLGERVTGGWDEEPLSTPLIAIRGQGYTIPNHTHLFVAVVSV